MSQPPRDSLTYRAAGVDIDAGNALVERIKPVVKRTTRPEVMGSLGGFGALFDLSAKYREPVLVSGTDGVGTKLRLAQQLNRHDDIGIDLVAMCVNDVLVEGAEPLFFLDYFASGKLDVDTAARVIAGVGRGCELAGCALIGGETAEMPDMYAAGEYDLAGFAVGAVEKAQLLDGARVSAGDIILGVASSGPHSNGFSLIRRVLEHSGNPFDLDLDGTTLIDALLKPTTIYVKPVLDLLRQPENTIHGLAHITGGGLKENIIRVVPDGLGIHIDSGAWPQPAIFRWLADAGNIAPTEMWRTFNCGIGFTVIVPADASDHMQAQLAERDLRSWPVGEIVAHRSGERVAID